MTQEERILNHLMAGNKLTPMEAFFQFQSMCLAQVVHSLKKKGHNIESKIINDEKTGKHYAQYWINIYANKSGQLEKL